MTAELGTISPLAAYLGSFLEAQLPAWVMLLLAVMVHWFFLLTPPVVMLGFFERKLRADIQMRVGPNRVRFFGFFQVVADFVSLVFKEDSNPKAQESGFFKWGVTVAIFFLFVSIASIPFAESWALSNLDSGVICVPLALTASNLFLFWAAYSAESQWSVLSAFRVLALGAAYQMPMVIAFISPILISGTTNFDAIVKSQGGPPWQWIAFHDPGALLSFVTLFVSLSIWQARMPFDHYRATGEISGSFESEYSGVRKGLLAFLEYCSLFLGCALLVTCFLGGWQTFFNLESFGRASNLVQLLFFLAKVFALAFISIWVRWSLPRMRIDQIINLCWKVLVPVGLFALLITMTWMVAWA